MARCQGFRSLFAAFIVFGLVWTQAAATIPHKNRVDSDHLLLKSYQISKDLVPAQRAFLLFHLATAAEPLAPKLSGQWAIELFRLTFELDSDWNRSALQKNAVAILSNTDPVGAFHILRKMSPLPNQSMLPEDLRADAANTAFLRYWNNKQAQNRLQAIRAQAQEIGKDGQYPYKAISPMLQYLLQKDKSAALAWFSEVCLAYQQGNPNIRSANPEFVAFVQEFWPKIPMSSRREALDVLVPKLTQADVSDPGAYLSRVKTSTRTFDFSDSNQKLLFDMLPLVSEVDSEWAERLTKEHFQAAAITEPQRPEQESQIYLAGNPSSTQQGAAESFLQREQQLRRVFDAMQQGPDKSLQMAAQLSDPDIHLRALEGITGSFHDKGLDSSEATIIDQTKKILEAATRPLDKLRALALLAEASASAGDVGALQQYIETGFDMGELLFEEFEQSHPVADIEGADLLGPLRRLVQTGMQFRRPDTIERIEQCQDQLLVAYLFLMAADKPA